MQGTPDQPASREIIVDFRDTKGGRGDFAFRQGAPFDLPKIGAQSFYPLR